MSAHPRDPGSCPTGFELCRVSKAELHDLAEGRGLVPAPTLTKTRTDALVVAEAGSQSSKAKNAARWAKPLIVAEEFLEWAGR